MDVPTSIMFGESPINQVNNAKFLGITIDSEFSWSIHVSTLFKKLQSGLYVLRSLKNPLSFDCLKSFYPHHFTLIHSHLLYGLRIWGKTDKYKLLPIMKTQDKALRIINKAKYNTPVNDLYKNVVF